MALKFAICFRKEDLGDVSAEDIEVGRVYEIVEENAGNGMMRIVDNSGEDYLYPSSWFEPVVLEESVASRLHDALIRAAA
jgi:hypothetical protein